MMRLQTSNIKLQTPFTTTRTNPLVTRRDRGKDSPLQATGHADLVPMKGKNGYYYAVFLGKRPIGGDGRAILGRETFACPALWRDGDLVFQDERLIAGEVVSPEEECETVLSGAKIHRVRDFKFDETIDAKDGESMILYRSADGNITLEGPGKLRMVSTDGLTVKCYRNDELVKEVSTKELQKRHTRFNGLGIGKITNQHDDGHTSDYKKGRIDVPVKRNDGHTIECVKGETVIYYDAGAEKNLTNCEITEDGRHELVGELMALLQYLKNVKVKIDDSLRLVSIDVVR